MIKVNLSQFNSFIMDYPIKLDVWKSPTLDSEVLFFYEIFIGGVARMCVVASIEKEGEQTIYRIKEVI